MSVTLCRRQTLFNGPAAQTVSVESGLYHTR